MIYDEKWLVSIGWRCFGKEPEKGRNFETYHRNGVEAQRILKGERVMWKVVYRRGDVELTRERLEEALLAVSEMAELDAKSAYACRLKDWKELKLALEDVRLAVRSS